MPPQLTEGPLPPITPPAELSVANGTLQKRRLYCLTVCGYRKPGLSEEEYVEYMTKKHSQLVRPIMAKYGVIRWSHAHNTTETRKLMAKLYDEQFANVADFDCFSQSIFESVDSLVRMKEDPLYDEFIRDDHNNFADTRRTKITIGWFEEYITDGKVVQY
ncbi:hypothetical protein MMC21_006541 [Puttea exsequens]|nr:hypothetical protein [Puttea exsequens]